MSCALTIITDPSPPALSLTVTISKPPGHAPPELGDRPALTQGHGAHILLHHPAVTQGQQATGPGPGERDTSTSGAFLTMGIVR